MYVTIRRGGDRDQYEAEPMDLENTPEPICNILDQDTNTMYVRNFMQHNQYHYLMVDITDYKTLYTQIYSLT